MQRFIYRMSTLVLATAIVTPSFADPPSPSRAGALALNRMEFNFTAPFISSSALLNDRHIIRVMVIGMSLEDVMISIPPQMAKFNQVEVIDESGKVVPAKITASKERVAIAFNQPVESGRTLQISILGIQTEREQGEILLYGVTAKRVGLMGEIPIGTARIQVPERG